MNYSVDQLKSLITQSDGMARSNLFAVQLPTIYKSNSTEDAFARVPILAPEELNVLCKATQLPGRQLNTVERRVGMQTQKVAYGYQVEDITLTFIVMNNYKIRKYFDAWQRLAVDYANGEVGYHSDYALPVQISQLQKGFSLPIYKVDLFGDTLDKIPSNIVNRLPTLPGPLGDILKTGELDLAFVTGDDVVYSVNLVGAFPTSIASVELNNELDGMVELSVQLSFTNWNDREEVSQGGDKGTGIESFWAGIMTSITDVVDNVTDVVDDFLDDFNVF